MNKRMRELHEKSGKIRDVQPLVEFLYLLIRGHLPAGVLESLLLEIRDGEEQDKVYCNGFLAQYAQNVAKMLQQTFVLQDRGEGYIEDRRLRVVQQTTGLEIQADGYGDNGTVAGHGAPIFIEFYEGRLRLIVFADINREDPTHVIDLEGAREDAREKREKTGEPDGTASRAGDGPGAAGAVQGS